jgi:phage/plasmid-like protein (TIGR03299 family)
MAHYFESGFFTREKAWHGLGQTLAESPATAREAIAAAGLDWQVQLAPCYADVGGQRIPLEDTRATVREVWGADGVRVDSLGVVGDRYTPLQNRDAFGFFDAFIQSGEAEYEAAGSLKGGRLVWILAKLTGEEAEVGTKAGDTVRPYLLLSTSHDGTRSTSVQFTPIRVVCWNTLSASYRAENAQNSRKVRHTARAADRLAEIRGTIDTARADFSAMRDAWRELSAYRLPESNAAAADVVRTYSRIVFGDPSAVKRAMADKAPLPEVRAEADIWRLLHRGPGADSAGRTAFGLLQAATHYLDHVAGRTPESRLAASWTGAAAETRQRATDSALALIGAGGAR